MAMNIRDVAKRAGVSPATVSRVLNDTGYPVRPNTRDRVLRAAEELNYFRNDLARGLLLKRTHTLGLIVPDLSNPYYAEILRGAEDIASSNNYAVIICNTENKPEKTEVSVEVLMQKRVDGIIISGGATEYELLESEMVAKGPEIVIVGRYRTGFPSVRVDNRGGSRRVVEHLLSLGHRRIGFISGPKVSTAVQDRLAGYRKALRDHGLSVEARLIVPGEFTERSGYEGMTRLLDLAEPPSAVVAANDRMAIGAMAAIRARGRSIPDDVAVAGFDDITMASYTNPPLTTVSLPGYLMGQTAASLMLELLASDQPAHRLRNLPTTLIPRGSTDPSLAGDEYRLNDRAVR